MWIGVSGPGEQTPGRVVTGRYRLETVVGRGGMGVVWRATDTLIERTVALKELRAPVGDESSFVERALREARNAGRLNHPGIVAVHDVIAPGGDSEAVYIVMEYVEAPSLAEVIDQQGPVPPNRVAAMGLEILDALEAAHAMGIVHRDIKPGNVLVRDDDRVKLSDFGIALAAEDTRLTRSGVMGTHGYLAPECFDAGQVGPAADLWALGATLFHAVAGRAPFERDTTTATLRAILFEDPPTPPCRPPLAQVITGLLTRPVDQRLTSATARQLLQQAATAPTIPDPPTTDSSRPAWQAQATTHHRPPPPPGPHRPQPPQRPAPPTGPVYGAPPPGRPPQRNNTPLVLGLVGAAAAALLAVVVLAASGASDSDGGGSGAGDGGEASGYTDAMHDDFLNECSSELTGVTVAEVGDNTCECVWSAIVDNVPVDVYRTALASADGDASAFDLPPTEMDADMENALQACLPALPTTTP